MENSTFTILSALQNILTFKNIEILKESFIVEKIKKHDPSVTLNQEFGILEYYDVYKDDFITLKFENHLTQILWNETQNCKEAIDSTFILLDSIKMKKFIKYIKLTIKYIENNERELLLKFSVCKKPLQEVTTYLSDKYNINFDNNIAINNSESLFKVKEGVSNKKFNSLYDITIRYNIIDDDKISEGNYIMALTHKITNEKIIFDCNNGLAMMYLEKISVLFDNLTGKTIESSGRFYTKRETQISESNYYKAKKNITIKDSETLSNFISDFETLLE